jgi:hypothetical protein
MECKTADLGSYIEDLRYDNSAPFHERVFDQRITYNRQTNFGTRGHFYQFHHNGSLFSE